MVRNVSDEKVNALVLKAREGGKEAFDELLKLYQPLICKSVLFFAGGDNVTAGEDDLRQEASIALYQAVKSFDLSQEKVTFGSYARRCVNNRIISTLRKDSRRPKNESEMPEDLISPLSDPLESMIDRESFSLLRKRIAEALSPYEKKVCDLFLSGKSTAAIAEKVGKSEKSVSNAIGRIRSKLEKIL